MQAKRVSRQARGLQGGMYEAVRKRVERSLSESREKNNDFFRIPIRFKIRYSSQFVTIRRKDSDKPLPPIKRLRAHCGNPVIGLTQAAVEPQPRRPPGVLGQETRVTRHGFCLARGASQREIRGFHEKLKTKN